MTCHTRIVDPNVRRADRAGDGQTPAPVLNRPLVATIPPRTPSRWTSMAPRLALWAGGALGLVLLTNLIAGELDSWLIGFVGSGIVALLVMAMLAAVSSAKIARRI